MAPKTVSDLLQELLTGGGGNNLPMGEFLTHPDLTAMDLAELILIGVKKFRSGSHQTITQAWDRLCLDEQFCQTLPALTLIALYDQARPSFFEQRHWWTDCVVPAIHEMPLDEQFQLFDLAMEDRSKSEGMAEVTNYLLFQGGFNLPKEAICADVLLNALAAFTPEDYGIEGMKLQRRSLEILAEAKP